jgi:hypothetical protein
LKGKKGVKQKIDLLYDSQRNYIIPMTTYITNEFIESVRRYIYNKAFILFKQKQKNQDQIFSMETWDPIFNEIKNQIRCYLDISTQTQTQTTDTLIPIVYPSETINDYIARISDLQRLGPYDYVLEVTGYIKNQIQIQNIEYINLIPIYEYISKNNMNLDEEPIYKNFRSNKQQFYEMYTLWDIKNAYIK